MRTKADIEYHQLGNGYKRVPAVNVKVRDTLSVGFRKWKKNNPDEDERFTEEWIEKHVSDDDCANLFWFACALGWEELQEKAVEIYGSKHVKVYSEGRSGGWAYIDGINTDVESWDAIEFGRWRSFSKFAKLVAGDIMYRIVDTVYYNNFDEWSEEQIVLRKALNLPQ